MVAETHTNDNDINLSSSSSDNDGDDSGGNDPQCDQDTQHDKKQKQHCELQQRYELDQYQYQSPQNTNTNTVEVAHAHRMMSCKVCSSQHLLPFKPSRDVVSYNDALWENAANAWDCDDGGFFDILRLVQERETTNIRIPKDLTREIVRSTTLKLRELKTKLVEAGLLHHAEQNFTAESVYAARIVAPLRASEVHVGRQLGSGGFSSVSAVQGFTLLPTSTTSTRSRKAFSQNEELSRKYLSEHANVHPLFSNHDTSSRSRGCCSTRTDSTTTDTISVMYDHYDPYDPFARYAIKHLRPSLMDQSHERILRAAVDLVLEGQLLMVLDHPNIVSIRGWSADGPKAFSSSVPSDYFLIIDRLPQTLEDVIGAWRSKVTRYRQRWRRATRRRDFCQRISGWLRPNHKLQPTSATTAVNDPIQRIGPSMYEMKLQSVLLEQLQTAFGVASAVAYMHSKRLIHRDIKSSNIGFDLHGQVKIFDLGLARLLPKSALDNSNNNNKDEEAGDVSSTHSQHQQHYESFSMSRVGTKFYMSPEVMRKDPYGTPADVYSFGVVVWQLFCLSTPRDYYKMQRQQYEQQQQVKTKRRRRSSPATANSNNDFAKLRRELKDGRANRWLPVCDCWPEAIRTLIDACMSNDANERPTMDHVCSILQDEITRVSAVLACCSNNNHHHHHQQQQHVPQRRRSTFRIDVSKMHAASLTSQDNYDESTTDQEGVCCGTSTTTNVTAAGADVPIKICPTMVRTDNV